MKAIPSNDLIHIGVVVKNARHSAGEFSRMYGISKWAVVDWRSDRLTGTTTHGFVSDQSFLTATGHVDTDNGPVTFQLIEPRGGWTTYTEFLIERGEGIHNVCTGRVSQQQFDELTIWLESEGIGLAQTTTLDGQQTSACLDTREALGGFYVQLIIGDSAPGQPDEVWDLSAEANERSAALPYNTFAPHLGLVVRNLMERVKNWKRLFGVDHWTFTNWHTAPGSLEGPTYMGQPVDHAYFTTVVSLNSRLNFEIIQPTSGPTHYKENYMNLVGEGIHHMNTTFLSDEDEWLKVKDRLKELGAPVVMSGGLANDLAKFYYLDTKERLGYVSEVVHPASGWDQGLSVIEIAMEADLSKPA